MNPKDKKLTSVSTGKVVFEFFPQPIIDLQRELMHPAHKDLMKYNSYDLVDTIKGICTELEIVLDGMYTGEDMVNLCPLIIERLIKKRGGLIVVTNDKDYK